MVKRPFQCPKCHNYACNACKSAVRCEKCVGERLGFSVQDDKGKIKTRKPKQKQATRSKDPAKRYFGNEDDVDDNDDDEYKPEKESKKKHRK